MKTEYSCEQCKNKLFDLVGSELPPLEQQLVDKHLQRCEECNADLANIWDLQSKASHWQDDRVPRWNRKQFFFEPSPWPVRMQWATSFASIMVLILVMTEARISTADGFAVDFSRSDSTFISQQEVGSQLVSFQNQQESQLDASVQRLTNQQIATNQLLLRTILDTSRQERRADLGNMLVLWEEAQDQRSMSTEESLRFLIKSQARDRLEINDLTNALTDNTQLNNERNF
jgi:hypothetical protein